MHKLTPILLTLAVILLVVLGGVALAETLINRGGTVNRTLSEQMTVSPAQDLTLGLDETSGTVVYTVSNPGPVGYTVTITPTCSSALSISSDKASFGLSPGQSQDVTLTLTFIDAGATSGTYNAGFST